jgi:choline kinase
LQDFSILNIFLLRVKPGFLPLKETNEPAIQVLQKPAFIILGAGRPHTGTMHSALRNTSGKDRVLSWLLFAAKSIDPDLTFVGGYRFNDIVKEYPDIQYIFNPEWQHTGAASSFLKVPFEEDKVYYVSYADILFRNSVIKPISTVDADIVVAVDSLWRERYGGRMAEDMARCEKVIFSQDIVERLGSAITPDEAKAEFIGLAKFQPRVINYIRTKCNELYAALKNHNLSQLIDHLRSVGFQVKAVDILGNWAEINVPSDLTHFILGTKAQTLARLQDMVRYSQIAPQVSFLTSEWQHDHSAILSRTKTSFTDLPVIVRSSCFAEDSFSSANAGTYKSVLNIDSGNSRQLAEAIEEVIASYPSDAKDNQVLIQPMLQDVYISGVVFTRTLEQGAPYYVINYDDVTGSTISITAGNTNRYTTQIILHTSDLSSKKIIHPIRNLLKSVQEIKQLLQYDFLDIEFAIDHESVVHIFQIRPLVMKAKLEDIRKNDHEIFAALDTARNTFIKLQAPKAGVAGSRGIFGIMPDWNPAEIIGTKPEVLSFDLYRYLITDDVWARQRAEYGYRDMRGHPLLVDFAGHPYVDIRASFNSFIPASLPDTIAQKLVDYYCSRLQTYPHLHDKIEFDIVLSCYSFNFVRRRQELAENGFSNAEIDQIERSLVLITHHAFKRNDLKTLDVIQQRHAELTTTAMLPPLERAALLLQTCRDYGTLPFAHLARSAFIAITLLKSAVTEAIIPSAAMDDFLNSLHTVTHRFAEDAADTAEGKISWDDFVSTYGHLRPGTYNINSYSYSEDPEYFLRPVVDASSNRKFVRETGMQWKKARPRFADALSASGFGIGIDEIEIFMRNAIEGREYAKFIFTRSLSVALQSFADFGTALGIPRSDLGNVSLETFLSLRTGSNTSSELQERLWEEIAKRSNSRNISRPIKLPPLLFNDDDFNIFTYPENQTNFIGSKTTTATCVIIDTITDEQSWQLSDCIVLITQADPGYDWLFGQGISGLITMWGGANSHMAIRCAEFGIPAAIGVGEQMFHSLSGASVIELNAENHLIQIIR